MRRVAVKVESHQGLIYAKAGLEKKPQYVDEDAYIYLDPPISSMNM